MKPAWLKQNIDSTEFGKIVRNTINRFGIHTICTEARCPNRNFCFNKRSLTILILGDICTRGCFFCSVKKGKPDKPDSTEPHRVAEACKAIGIKHIVITSVTRDDLPDGGAGHFAEVVRAIKSLCDDIVVEVLVPDFMGRHELIDIVLSSGVDIFGHNIETVPRLYKKIRPNADYDRSLDILAYVSGKGFVTKTGIMVGCGETDDEVFSVICDVASVGVNYIVIGQYLQPSSDQIPVERFVTPEQFHQYADYARKLGLIPFSFPLARSSFMSESYVDITKRRDKTRFYFFDLPENHKKEEV